MVIKLASNQHRNRFGILYFRLTITKDLQNHFAAKVIYRSLCCANPTKPWMPPGSSHCPLAVFITISISQIALCRLLIDRDLLAIVKNEVEQ